MPSEKFYTTCPATGETLDMVFELAWQSQSTEYSSTYLTAYTPQETEDGEPYMQVHSVLDLDRDDLNRMIRALRRARNAKYGSDE